MSFLLGENAYADEKRTYTISDNSCRGRWLGMARRYFLHARARHVGFLGSCPPAARPRNWAVQFDV